MADIPNPTREFTMAKGKGGGFWRDARQASRSFLAKSVVQMVLLVSSEYFVFTLFISKSFKQSAPVSSTKNVTAMKKRRLRIQSIVRLTGLGVSADRIRLASEVAGASRFLR